VMHQVWACYFPGSGFAFAEAREGLDYEQISQLLLGERLSEPLPEVTITRLSRGKMADMLGAAWPGFMISPKLRAILEECCGSDTQFIPVRIKRHPKLKYSIVNFLAQVPCLDRSRSDFETFSEPPHAIQTLRKMVLKPIPETAPAIFHIAELPQAVLVRDDLRERMQAVSSSPGRFIRVEDYAI
jgi:hypothetical protein